MLGTYESGFGTENQVRVYGFRSRVNSAIVSFFVYLARGRRCGHVGVRWRIWGEVGSGRVASHLWTTAVMDTNWKDQSLARDRPLKREKSSTRSKKKTWSDNLGRGKRKWRAFGWERARQRSGCFKTDYFTAYVQQGTMDRDMVAR